MSVTIQRVAHEEEVEHYSPRRARLEARWDTFLMSLPAWELHALTSRRESNGDSTELFLHDQYLDGTIRLREVEAAVRPAGEEVK